MKNDYTIEHLHIIDNIESVYNDTLNELQEHTNNINIIHLYEPIKNILREYTNEIIKNIFN